MGSPTEQNPFSILLHTRLTIDQPRAAVLGLFTYMRICILCHLEFRHSGKGYEPEAGHLNFPQILNSSLPVQGNSRFRLFTGRYFN